MSSSRRITLRSSDGVSYEVERSVAELSQTIKHAIEADCADGAIPVPDGAIPVPDGAIPVPNVTSQILAEVIDYCNQHVETARAEDRVNEDLRAWDAEFVEVDEATVCDLMKAADYLDIESLLDLTSQRGAYIAVGKIEGKIFKEILDEVKTIKEEKETSQREADIVARMIRGKTFEKILDEVMKIFGFKKEEKEEKEEVRRILEPKMEEAVRWILITLTPRGRKRKWGAIL